MASDDGFREIQLSGKQLVFLFMATTIVAVVIFLCGVMVGRGVKAPGTAAAAAPQASVPTPDAQPLADNLATPKSDQPAAGATAKDAQSADSQAQGAKPAADKASSTAPPDEPPVVAEEPAAKTPAAAPAAANSAPAPAASNEPAGDGWIVQVAALADQAQANAIASRLVSKGYSAYVTAPPPGGGMFRVRVGKFKERRQADTVLRRLQKEEQLKPWITR
jgi:cell division septation protein DedD